MAIYRGLRGQEINDANIIWSSGFNMLTWKMKITLLTPAQFKIPEFAKMKIFLEIAEKFVSSCTCRHAFVEVSP